MNEVQAAADGVRSLARQYRSVLAMADVLQPLGDLEAHRLELERRRDTAQAELDGILASLTGAKAVQELEDAKGRAESALAALRADTEAERAKLASVQADQAIGVKAVAELRSEAATLEKQVASLRADYAAMKARFV